MCDYQSSTIAKLKQAATVVSAILCALSFAGCATYQFGPRAMFRPDIRTIYVPIAKNETYRHDLGVRLTEAIVRKIEDRTPYKVTGDPLADSVLTCRFATDQKSVLTETGTDELRAFDAVVTVEASWISRQGQVLMENRILPPGSLAMLFSQESRVVPEAGQSVETGLQDAIEDLADRIVAQMEMRW